MKDLRIFLTEETLSKINSLILFNLTDHDINVLNKELKEENISDNGEDKSITIKDNSDLLTSKTFIDILDKLSGDAKITDIEFSDVSVKLDKWFLNNINGYNRRDKAKGESIMTDQLSILDFKDMYNNL